MFRRSLEWWAGVPIAILLFMLLMSRLMRAKACSPCLSCCKKRTLARDEELPKEEARVLASMQSAKEEVQVLAKSFFFTGVAVAFFQFHPTLVLLFIPFCFSCSPFHLSSLSSEHVRP